MAYPALVITYLGQAAYLMVNPQNYSTTFYSCIPTPVYWPVFVVAVGAAIVASQVTSYALVPPPATGTKHKQQSRCTHRMCKACMCNPRKGSEGGCNTHTRQPLW